MYCKMFDYTSVMYFWLLEFRLNPDPYKAFLKTGSESDQYTRIRIFNSGEKKDCRPARDYIPDTAGTRIVFPSETSAFMYAMSLSLNPCQHGYSSVRIPSSLEDFDPL